MSPELDRATGHRVTVFTGGQNLIVDLDVSDEVRLSSWLAMRNDSLPGHLVRDGKSRPVLINLAQVEAILDEQPPYVDRLQAGPRVRVPAAITFPRGLRVAGQIHLPEGGDWRDSLAFEPVALRPITDSQVSRDGVILADGATAIVNLALALTVESPDA